MKKSFSTTIGLLYLALPVILFSCTSHSLNQVVLLLLSCLGLFSVISVRSTNTNQNKWNIWLPPILILLLIIGFFLNKISAYNLSSSIALTGFFIFFITTVKNQKKSLIFKALFLIVSLEIILLIISHITNSISFTPNNSIFSILLSCQFCFLAPKIISLIKKRINKKPKQLFYLSGAVFLCYSALFLTSGRAGFISFSLALFLININFIRKNILSKKITIISALLLLLGISFLFKRGSTNGRILIYKVVLHSTEPIHFFTGIGYGQFKAKYNRYQSDYFSKHSINSNEALLADNTYYAFNDPFQLILELGITGFIIFSIFIRSLCKKFISDLQNGALRNSALFGSHLCIFSFLCSSFFSYPLQILKIIPIFILSLSIVFAPISYKTKPENGIQKPKIQHLRFLLYLILSSISLFLGYKFLITHYKTKEAEHLAKAGFKLRSANIYSDLSSDMIVDESIYYAFAAELAKLNKTDTAISVLKKSIKYIYNDHSALLLANLYYDKGMLSIADSFYKEAVFINPKSFRNRFALFTFYLDTKQKEKSIYWGKSIIELEPKVPSNIVTNIKTRTANILEKIQ